MMAKFEVQLEKIYWKYITIEAPDEDTARTLAREIVEEPDSECGDGFLDYGNSYETRAEEIT